MAVYKRTYTRYAGPRTPERWRFGVLGRYALKTVFEARLNTMVFVVSFVPHVIALVIIYLVSNLDALAAMNLPVYDAVGFITVDEYFFLTLLRVQTFFSFVLVALAGPGLVSPDLTNNALPLYLSRPFSRTEYVLGKLSVLAALVSLITWIPGLLLILIQITLAGGGWLWDHPRAVFGMIVGSWVWILTVSLIALALSAWVRWKPVAVAGLFAIFFVAAGFGSVSDLLLDMRWGMLLNMTHDMHMIWSWLLLGQSEFRHPFSGDMMPAWTGLLAMLGIAGGALFLLNRRVRAVYAVR